MFRAVPVPQHGLEAEAREAPGVVEVVVEGCPELGLAMFVEALEPALVVHHELEFSLDGVLDHGGAVVEESRDVHEHDARVEAPYGEDLFSMRAFGIPERVLRVSRRLVSGLWVIRSRGPTIR